MSTSKIIIMGKEKAGKSQIFNRILGEPFSSKYYSTLAPDLKIKKLETTTLYAYDQCGIGKELDYVQSHQYGADFGVYCVDLSQPIDLETMTSTIASFKHIAPYATVIILGTKSDICSDVAPTLLESIKEHVKADKFLLSSAKLNEGIHPLLEIISHPNDEEDKYLVFPTVVQPSTWQWAVEKLNKELKNLPEAKREQIQRAVSVLQTRLKDSPDTRAQAISDFITSSQTTLKDEQDAQNNQDKRSSIMNAIITVAAVAIVTVVAALTGFGIGFAAGLWTTGPSAFITGLMAANTTEVCVTAGSSVFGALAGGFTLYSLFTPNRVISAIDIFVEEARGCPANSL